MVWKYVELSDAVLQTQGWPLLSWPLSLIAKSERLCRVQGNGKKWQFRSRRAKKASGSVTKVIDIEKPAGGRIQLRIEIVPGAEAPPVKVEIPAFIEKAPGKPPVGRALPGIETTERTHNVAYRRRLAGHNKRRLRKKSMRDRKYRGELSIVRAARIA